MLKYLVLLLLLWSSAASAMMEWRMEADAGARQQPGEKHEHNRPRGRGVALQDGADAVTELWLPTLERRPLPLQGNVAVLRPSGLDNYHLLYAVRERHGVLETALRYHYMNGKPSKRSPAELIGAVKTPLEIVPSPLAREHARYLSEREAVFEVRYQNRPMAEHPVALETSNGTRWYTRTDLHGKIAFALPDDFSQLQKGRENNQPADFVLLVSHVDGGTAHHTSLSAPYYVNPRHWQSFAGGLAASLAGFSTGVVILVVAGRRAAVRSKKERRV